LVEELRQAQETWEERARTWGVSYRSVLFKGFPEVLNRHLHRWHVRVVLDHLGPVTPLRVLDVGCGWGRICRPILERVPGAEVVGLDISERFVELYRFETGQAAHVGSVTSLPKGLGRFDCVVCVTTLMYVPRELLAESVGNLLSVLEPGGRLIIIEPDRSGRQYLSMFGAGRLAARLAGKERVDTGGRNFEPEQLPGLLAGQGAAQLAQLRIPATTINIGSMWIAGRVLPEPVAAVSYRPIARLDHLLGGLRLPSLHVAYIAEKTGK
jgi:2-polyprenyl-3-methyl-5-hydroxy-6-metoxy-1,4-benzoquinol methylase